MQDIRTASKSWDVVVAGAGPVGALVALDLARRGIATLLVEPEEQANGNPRCNTINSTTMESLRHLGIAEEVRACGLPDEYPTDVAHFTRLGEHEIARLALPSRALVRSEDGYYGDWPTPEPPHRCSQVYFQNVLMAAIDREPLIDVAFSTRVADFVQDAAGVDVTLRRAAAEDDSADLIVWTRFLVGCDGSASTVRRVLGITLEGTNEILHRISVHFRSKSVGELAGMNPAWMYLFHNTVGNSSLIAVDGVSEFLFSATIPLDSSPQTLDAVALVRNAVGDHEIEVLNLERWTARRLVADSYGSGNVFVAGDAAHLWVPTGGFGMNTGIADGLNLSWKIAGVLSGWADESILPTYELERRPVADLVSHAAEQWTLDRLAMMAGVDVSALEQDGEQGRAARTALGEGLREHDFRKWRSLGLQFGYSYAQSPVIWSDSAEAAVPRVDIYELTTGAQLGVRLPHFWVEPGVSIFDRLSGGFTLVMTDDLGGAGVDFLAAASKRGCPLDVVTIPAESAQGFIPLGCAVLVRPDGHVGWLGVLQEVTAVEVLDTVCAWR